MSVATAQLRPPSATRSALGWAVFLGCSWTWCIGMFLPVLLLREMGLAGWLVFAIPNVLGAAAMGFILRDDHASPAIVRHHRLACLAFSLVTIAFHLFFIFWISLASPLPSGWLIVGVGACLAMGLTGLGAGRRDPRSALVVWILSLAAFAAAAWILLKVPVPRVPPAAGPEALRRALYLAPVCIFGFLLCPYLDLTFHRARQATSPPQSRLAFALGFGVFFFLMICFSLLYAAPLGTLLEPRLASTLPLALVVVIAFHMAAQAGFTLAMHFREVEADSRRHPILIALVLLASAALGVLVTLRPGLLNLTGESVYRLFMGFYGLVFPAYVWLCMLPARRTDAPPAVRHWLVFALAILIAAPFFYRGFIGRHYVWLLPGVGLLLLSRLLIPRSIARPQPQSV